MTTSEQIRGPAAAAGSDSQSIGWDIELDNFVMKLERAYGSAQCSPVEITQFCPSSDHPRYSTIVLELIRVDMELAAAAGRVPSLDYYRLRFGHLVDQDLMRDQLAYEISRLQNNSRLAASTTPKPSSISCEPNTLPAVGQTLCGFQIVGELGRGSFGRVYLASESGLANRRVVIKVSSQFPGEAELLSKLQHKNIVPVYSLHHYESMHVVCMPLLGTATLGGLLQAIEQAGQTPPSALALIDTIRNCASQTWPATPTPHIQFSTQEELSSNSAAIHSLPLDSVALERLRNRFSGQSYAHGVVWIIAQLAEGLAHAHERSIVHRDIKPANILLADDGLPMLLDFNLSFESSPAAVRPEVFGGTPRYMSPEQLEEVLTDKPSSDHRSDIYSLGLIMFELLTMRSPFNDRKGINRDVLRGMYEDRQIAPIVNNKPGVGVTSGIVAIVQKALQFSADQRYQSAHDMLVDLQCELQYQPLQVAQGERWKDRIRKWNLRHPRLSASSMVLVISCIFLALSLFGLMEYRHRANYAAAMSTLQKSQTELCEAQGLLAAADLTNEHLEALLESCQVSLDSIQSITPTRLPKEQIQLWQDCKAQLLVLQARGLSSLAMRTQQFEQCRKLLTRASEDLQAAFELVPEQRQVHQLAQRAVARALGKTDLQTMQLELLSALRLSDNSLQTAIDSMRARQKYEASNSNYWMNLALLQLAARDRKAAQTSLDVATQLDDQAIWPRLTIGLLELESKSYVDARNSLDAVLRKSPTLSAAKFNRALANIGLGQIHAAKEDLESLESSVAQNTRILFVREMVYRQLGNFDKADRDRNRGLQLQPTDGLSWNARGEAKLGLAPPDVSGALADFQMAIIVAPHLRNSYQNSATVLSEYLKQPSQAIEALDQAIQCDPNYAMAWSSRGVLKARMGKAEESILDVRKALELDRAAIICYQAASAYALVRRDDSDEQQAMNLLRETLTKDSALAYLMPDDTDLVGIKDKKTLQQIIAAAKILR